MTSHRTLIRFVLTGLSLVLLSAWLAPTTALADTSRYRLSWRTDPSTTMVIGWAQGAGTGERVHYDTMDHGTDWASYASSQAPDRSVTANGMNHRFVRLAGLLPDTAYYFVVHDDRSTSIRMWFKTAPAGCATFTFVAGGDSRDNQGARQDGNTLVSKLRPLFVYFGGDYVFDGGDAGEMQDWLDDWQLTRSLDGRMYPIVATRGNHELNADVQNTFDSPSANIYFALSFGGTQLRTYTLNSEITEGGTQGAWLANDLATSGVSHTFRVAQYHKPMRPHTTSKSEGTAEYAAWANTFYTNGMDLVVECDSHLVKRTYPVRPSTAAGNDEGFVRDDATGTVYVGEGGWGAPLRNADDGKAWTRAMDSFNQVSWVHVLPTELRVRTIRTRNSDQLDEVSDAAPLALPAGLDVWAPNTGAVIMIAARAGVVDTDGDTVPDACDPCPDDNPDDTDLDGVCDTDDACPGFDDTLDTDGDRVADGCDPCPLDWPDDSDSDGVCDTDDACPGSDDTIDTDGDGVPNGCDACPLDDPDDSDGDSVCDTDDDCPGFDDRLDMDGDSVADGCDACAGFDDRVDSDGDGVADGCDPCPADILDDSDSDGVCDSSDVCPGFDDAVGVPAVGPGASLRLGPGGGLTWSAVTDAMDYPVHRGRIPRWGGMASRGAPYDHACLLASPLPQLVDADLPGVDAFYYLVSARNPCGEPATGLGTDSRATNRPRASCP